MVPCSNQIMYLIVMIGDMLDADLLPEVLLGPCLDVLRELSDERDLIRLVVEIVQELRDAATDTAEVKPLVDTFGFSLTLVSHKYRRRPKTPTRVLTRQKTLSRYRLLPQK